MGIVRSANFRRSVVQVSTDGPLVGKGDPVAPYLPRPMAEHKRAPMPPRSPPPRFGTVFVSRLEAAPSQEGSNIIRLWLSNIYMVSHSPPTVRYNGPLSRCLTGTRMLRFTLSAGERPRRLG